MNTHPSKERTLVIVKPDGVQRSFIGEIVKRIEQTGLKLVGIKLFVPDGDFIEQHYLLEDDWKVKSGTRTIEAYKARGKEPPTKDPVEVAEKILKVLRHYMTAGPVVAMVWQGAHAAAIVKKLVGSTEPLTSDVGTIRGDFVVDSYEMSDIDGRSARNLVHCSADKESAKQEIKHWFKENEVINYRLIQEQILYDVNLDGILE